MITPVILQYKSGIPQKQFAYIRSEEMAQALDIAIAALEELEKKQLKSC